MAYAAESKHDEYVQEYTNFLELIRKKILMLILFVL